MWRYSLLGRAYDAISLERPLYRRPRAELLGRLDLRPGWTVVDLGCGTGLNLPGLVEQVGPAGRVIGVDASASMLAAARRRVRRAGWRSVRLVPGDAADLLPLLDGLRLPGGVDAVVATFVLSLLDDDAPVWRAVDELARDRPLRVGLADLGEPAAVPRPLRPVLGTLTRVGGGDPRRRPWEALATRAADTWTGAWFGGHVHVAVGTCAPPGRPVRPPG